MKDKYGNRTKYCAECDRHRLLNYFDKSNKTLNGFRRLCKDCTQLENKETRQLVRLEVLIYYSFNIPKCECCEENRLEFLSIDHIDGGGAKHRKEDPSSIKIYAWLKRNKFPKGFRVLCMNCNFAHGRYGYCPHKSSSQLISKLPENYEQRKYKRWSAKVTLDDVFEIRKRASAGDSSALLARDFGISQHSVNNIVAHRRWKDV